VRHGGLPDTVLCQRSLPQYVIQFIVFLPIFQKLLGDAKLLSDMFQSSSLDLAKAVDLVEALISTFESYKSDDLWDTVLKLEKKCDVSIHIILL